jgi:hypothetical protein
VRVTDAAGARLVGELGTYTTLLDGRVTPAAGAGRGGAGGGDSVAVAVAIGREYRGVALESVRQTLYLGRSEVVEVRRRELSRGRTAATAVGALAGFALLVGTVVQLGDDNPSGEGPPPPPPPAFRVHLPLRLPIH